MGNTCSRSTVQASANDGASADEDQLGQAIRGMSLVNGDGEAMTYVSHRRMEEPRRKVIATAFPSCGAAATVLAVVATNPAGQKKELVVVVEDGKSTQVMGACQITYEDLSPSDCIEYAFKEDPEGWAMVQLSRDALENYRGMKFEEWRKMLLKPTCEAAFRRMLQIGVVTRLYDTTLFPTPEAQKSLYQVVDDRTGKLLDMPHPVHGLRLWDAEAGRYEAIDPLLTGAPSDAEASKWWESFCEELSQEHGAEYIASLRAGK